MAQGLHVAVLNMASVLAQMEGDDIGAGLLGHQGSLNGLGIAGPAHLAQGSNMVDIDTKQNGMSGHAGGRLR